MIEGTTYNSSIPGSIDVNQLVESFNKILTEINLMILKLFIGLVRRILEFASIKLIFVL